MYCSNCGAEAGGNFCAACGARLQPPPGPAPSPAFPAAHHTAPGPLEHRAGPQENGAAPQSAAAPHDDWAHEVVYEKLLQAPGVRERIADAGRRSKRQMTGEEFLALFDSVVPTGVSLTKLTTALLPMYERMGIRTGKDSELTFTAPAGRVLLATLCALAAGGTEIRQVEQMSDGCVLTAFLPSTMWTNRGELIVSVHRSPQAVHVHAATRIAGQLFDWGKSRQILRRLFEEIRCELASQQSSHIAPGRHVA